MTRTALTTAVLVALAVVCLPIRADAEKFTLELEAGVQEITRYTDSRMRRRPRSIMAKDLHALVVGVGNQLLHRNEQMKKEKVPVNERLPILRQLYLTEMRKLHKLKPDGNTVVRYNEMNQTLMFYYFEFSSSGGFSGGGGGGGGIGSLTLLLEVHMAERDSFALNLSAALLRLERDWGRFGHANFGLLSAHRRGHFSTGSPIPPVFPGFAPSPASISPLEYPRGILSLGENISYELSKLDVELSLKGRSDEERAEKLRKKLVEIVRKLDKLTPTVQFDEGAAELSFYDSSGRQQLDASGAPLTYKFPSLLMSALNIQMSEKAVESRIRRFMIGAAAVVLLLFGGIYLAMKFGSSQEENESAESE